MRAVLDRALLMARTRDDYAPRTTVQPNMLTFEDGKNVATVGNCDRYLFSESLARTSQTYISSGLAVPPLGCSGGTAMEPVQRSLWRSISLSPLRLRRGKRNADNTHPRFD